MEQNTQPANQPDYSFLNQAPKRRSFSFPKLNLPRPVGIILLVLLIMFLLILVLSLRGGQVSPMYNVAARQTEILRVNTLATGNIKDSQVLNLVSTVAAVFSAEKRESAHYLHTKISDGRFNLYLNKSADSQLQTAIQNNNYSDVYLKYLKNALQVYSQNLTSASAKLAQTSTAQQLITNDFNDTQTLLADPSFRNL